MNLDDINTPQQRSVPVLVVDANADHQLLIGYSLRISVPEVEPVFAATDQEALAYLKRCEASPAAFPQLVLLDPYSPQAETGWQLLKEIKMRYPHLPVFVLSALRDSDDVRRAYELGANSFIGKPTNLPQWEEQFQILRTYWLQVVTLPSPG